MDFFEVEIQRVVQETSDSYSFIGTIPSQYEWRAGQYAVWKLLGKDSLPKKEQSRVFTIASCPEDGFLMFTTRIGQEASPFKSCLLHEIRPGDTIGISLPKGEYRFHEEKKHHLAIAGGIGITPIRSLVRHLLDNPMEGHDFTILYSDGRDEYCYPDLWERVRKEMPQLQVKLIADREECQNKVTAYAKQRANEAEYLIAGSPGMNKAYQGQLAEDGIEEENIVVDNFLGY